MSKVIAIVGAGGKTTLVGLLSEKYRREGQKVLVTTSTKMGADPDTDFSCDFSAIKEKLDRTGYCKAGKIYRLEYDIPQPPVDEQAGQQAEPVLKFGELPHDLFVRLSKEADITIVEADGAKHMNAKYPREGEPVIPPGTDEVIILMGLAAVGKAAGEAVFRFQEMQKHIDVKAEDMIGLDMLYEIIEVGYMPVLEKECPGAAVRIMFTKRDEKGILQYLTEEEAKALYE